LPTRIFLLDPDGKSSKDFVLKITPQAANPQVSEDNFKGKELPGWKVVRNPGGDANARPAVGARPAQPAPAVARPDPAVPRSQQPATKGGLFRLN
jgi:hypothetical protein